MPEMIDRALFEELTQTGALKISPEEGELLRAELNEQLSVIRQLESIPLSDVHHPVVHGNPYPPEIRCGLREDVRHPFAAPEEILLQAPVSKDGYFVSPDVPHIKLA